MTNRLSWPDEGLEAAVLAWCVRFRPSRGELLALKSLADDEAEALLLGVDSMLCASSDRFAAPLRVLLEHMSQAVGRAIERVRPFVSRAALALAGARSFAGMRVN